MLSATLGRVWGGWLGGRLFDADPSIASFAPPFFKASVFDPEMPDYLYRSSTDIGLYALTGWLIVVVQILTGPPYLS